MSETEVACFSLSAGDLSLLRFLSQSAAQERAAGADGWMMPPDFMPPYLRASLETLIHHELVESSSGWVRPTEAGEGVLAQAEAIHVIRQ